MAYKDREKEREYQRRWREANPARCRRYRKTARQKDRERARRYRAANPDAYRRWQRENPERVAMHSQLRRARKANATIGDPAAIAARENEIRKSRWCEECEAEVDDLHVDHVVPLAKGGAHSVDNLQGLCARHNLEKGASLPRSC